MEESLKNRKATLVGTCIHEDCDPFERIHTKPANPRITRVPTQKVPFCRHCGALKNVSSDKPKLIGFYTNLVRIVNHSICLQFGKLTQAQQRLIIAEIEKVTDFEDRYQMTRSAQLDLFFIAIHKIRPEIPFWALERAVSPESDTIRQKRDRDEVKALPAWMQYLEWLKKKRARDAAGAATGTK